MPRDPREANPFVGPRAFRRSETLYGREWETRQLVDLLVASRVVLVHAPSGAGKTSLLRTGLARECLRLGVGRPRFIKIGIEPPEHVKNRYVWSAAQSLQPLPRGSRPRARGSLAERFDRWHADRLARIRGRWPHATDGAAEKGLPDAEADARPSSSEPSGLDAPRVLVFDQFEEIITRDSTDLAAKEAFFDQLSRLLHNPRWWAIFAIRDDYLGAFEPFARHLPTRLRDRFRLDFLSEQAARAAMQKPAGVVRVRFTNKAAARLVNDLRQVRVQQFDRIERQPGPFVEPVHLQVVCRRLFEQRQHPDRINEADVEALAAGAGEGQKFESGVDLALASYYREVVDRTAVVSGVRERRVREWIEGNLISPGGLRRQVLKEGKTIEGGLPVSALGPLLNAYITREDPRRGVTFIELAHDRLVEPIRRDNRIWREQSLNQLQRQAPEWAALNRPDRLLLRGRALREAQRWAAEHGNDIEAVERALLEASLDTDLRRSNLAETGWGVVFAERADPAIREALGELLAHRYLQATAKDPRFYRECGGAAAYKQGETADAFVGRHGASLSAVRPERLPYYLLLVGHPREIPWDVQYDLDVAYAVGRLWFESVADYAHYAHSVVASEQREFAVPSRAAVFAPNHHFDHATETASRLVVEPLVAKLQDNPGTWLIDTHVGTRATREQLTHLLGDQAPALLFGVTHLTTPADGSASLEGGIVCADWPGSGRPVSAEHLFTSKDVSAEARLLGTILVLLANSSAGQSPRDEFRLDPQPAPAREPFVAPLACRLLAHPPGGALAVLGHVDELWMTSFLFEEEYEYSLFEKIVRRLLDGHTVGSAADLLGQRYSRLRAKFDELLRASFLEAGDLDRRRLQMPRTAMLDARNYVVLGDPAVRLRGALPGSTEHARTIRPGTIEDGRQALEAIARPVPSAGESQDSPVVGNGVWLESGSHCLPRMTAEQLGTLLAGTTTAGVAEERLRVLREYQDAREMLKK